MKNRKETYHENIGVDRKSKEGGEILTYWLIKF